MCWPFKKYERVGLGKFYSFEKLEKNRKNWNKVKGHGTKI